ncbi:MAG: type II toxin-antitoxin system Phd/YefM family antitoxin [Gammaproteobacteria bacterium]|nr:type II toxin-antitoxin system Phd/YefM family antitoxin [Gammaproteobacteria bacterium]
MKKQTPVKKAVRESTGTVSVVEAREKFGDLVNRAALLSERVYVTKHGKRVAALVSVEDAELLEALEDRLDLEAVKKARADIARHGTIPLEQLAKELGL